MNVGHVAVHGRLGGGRIAGRDGTVDRTVLLVAQLHVVPRGQQGRHSGHVQRPDRAQQLNQEAVLRRLGDREVEGDVGLEEAVDRVERDGLPVEAGLDLAPLRRPGALGGQAGRERLDVTAHLVQLVGGRAADQRADHQGLVEQAAVALGDEGAAAPRAPRAGRAS